MSTRTERHRRREEKIVRYATIFRDEYVKNGKLSEETTRLLMALKFQQLIKSNPQESDLIYAGLDRFFKRLGELARKIEAENDILQS